jgi:hypothetical protein
VTETDARWQEGKRKLQHLQNFVLLHSKKNCFILIFLSVGRSAFVWRAFIKESRHLWKRNIWSQIAQKYKFTWLENKRKVYK